MMKRLLFLAALLAGTVSAAEPAWEALKIGGGGNNLKLTFDPSDPDRIYLAIDVAGVVRSLDGGESWRNHNKGLHGLADGNYPCGDIAVAPQNPNLLYASFGREFRAQSGIIRSTDRGESWQLISTEVCGYGEGSHHRKHGDTGLLIDPADSNHLYVIDLKHNNGAGGLWESVDGGVHWKQTGLAERKINTVRFHPADPKRIYAACANHTANPGGFLISVDGGKTWAERGLAGKNVVNFRFDPTEPRTIYAVAGLDGFFRSDDDGVSWREFNRGLPLACDGARGKFYEYRYRALATDPFRPGRLVIAADPIRAFYESTDRGETWRKLETVRQAPPGWMLSGEHMGWHTGNIYFHPTRKDTLFLNDFFGTWKSTDNGRTWRINPYGQESSCMVTVLPDRSVPGRLYLGIWDHFMLIQEITPKGEVSRRPSGLFHRVPVNKHLSSIVQFAEQQDRLIGVTNSTHLFVSKDRGMAWREITEGLPLDSKFRLGAPVTGNGLHAFIPVNGKESEDGGVYRTRDGGETWSRPANRGVGEVSVCGPYDPRRDTLALTTAGKLYLATGGKLQLSADQAESWRELATPAPALSIVAFGKELLLGTETRGLWKSLDGGETWQPTPIETGRVRHIAAQGDRRLVYTITRHKDGRLEYHLLGSRDGGKSFQELLNDSLPVWNIQGIALDPFSNRIYANTYWSGSWSAAW